MTRRLPRFLASAPPSFCSSCGCGRSRRPAGGKGRAGEGEGPGSSHLGGGRGLHGGQDAHHLGSLRGRDVLGHVHDGIHGDLWIGLDEAASDKAEKKIQSPQFSQIWPQFVRWLERWETMARPTAGRLPADLLEDVISADVLDVLVDDGPGALLFGQLPLQPRHHLFVVVPQIGLRNRRRGAQFCGAATRRPTVTAQAPPCTRLGNIQRN